MWLSLHLHDTTFAKQRTQMLDNKTYRSMGNCEEELPRKPVNRLSVDRLPTGYQHTTDSEPTGYQQFPK